MQKRSWYTGIVCLIALATGVPLYAQSAGEGKPPIFIYISEWAVPRAQWTQMLKVDDADKPLMDKLVSDGTLTGYGAFTNLIHQEGEPTHGTWMTATSEGNLLKALEALYAHPESVTAPVEGESKHWDYILVSRMYNQRSGKSENGYLAGEQWTVKPGQMHAYNELLKTQLVPIYEKLLADGTITSYGMGTNDFHTGKMGVVSGWFTTADAASFDKASKTFDDELAKNPTLQGALMSLLDREGHRDILDRLRYANYK